MPHAYPSGQREPAQDRLLRASQVRILSRALRNRFELLETDRCGHPLAFERLDASGLIWAVFDPVAIGTQVPEHILERPMRFPDLRPGVVQIEGKTGVVVRHAEGRAHDALARGDVSSG